MNRHLSLFAIVAGFAASVVAFPAGAQITFTGETGAKANGYTLGGITFNNAVAGGTMQVGSFFESNGSEALGAFNDTNGNGLLMAFGLATTLSFSFGNDDPGFTNDGDLALLRVFLGADFVGQTTVALNRNDLMDQTIGYGFNGPFDNAYFAYVAPDLTPFTGGGMTNIGLIEIVDNIFLTPVPEPETYALLLAGLGLMGFVARRRHRNLAAA